MKVKTFIKCYQHFSNIMVRLAQRLWFFRPNHCKEFERLLNNLRVKTVYLGYNNQFTLSLKTQQKTHNYHFIWRLTKYFLITIFNLNPVKCWFSIKLGCCGFKLFLIFFLKRSEWKDIIKLRQRMELSLNFLWNRI